MPNPPTPLDPLKLLQTMLDIGPDHVGFNLGACSLILRQNGTVQIKCSAFKVDGSDVDITGTGGAGIFTQGNLELQSSRALLVFVNTVKVESKNIEVHNEGNCEIESGVLEMDSRQGTAIRSEANTDLTTKRTLTVSGQPLRLLSKGRSVAPPATGPVLHP